MAPLALSDEQMDAIFRAARPLRVADRDAFLQDVAAARRLATATCTARSLTCNIDTTIRRSWTTRPAIT